jgi:hypothetical protein
VSSDWRAHGGGTREKWGQGPAQNEATQRKEEGGGLCGRERLSAMWASTARMRQLWAALTVVGGARLTGAEGAGREQGKAACARRGVDVIDRGDRVKLANSKYTGGGVAQMVHVASSLRSRRSEAEDSRYDGSGVAQWKSDENALH